MKTLIGLLTFGTAVLMAPLAEARGHSHSGPTRTYVEFHRSCGGPAYVERYVAFYDDCGYPIFRTRIIPIRRAYRPDPYCGPAVRPYYAPRPGITVRIGGGGGGYGYGGGYGGGGYGGGYGGHGGHGGHRHGR